MVFKITLTEKNVDKEIKKHIQLKIDKEIRKIIREIDKKTVVYCILSVLSLFSIFVSIPKIIS